MLAVTTLVTPSALAQECPHCPDDINETGFGNEGCKTCHLAHGGYGPKLDPNVGTTIENLCGSCHYAGGPGTEVNTHTSTTGGCDNCEFTFSISCVDCHNPHSHEQSYDDPSDPGSPDALLRSAVRLPGGGDAPFTLIAPEGNDSFADGDADPDGICEVCHTQTTHHTSAGNDTAHNPGVTCTLCHGHNDTDHGFGFRASGSCTPCHGNPPEDALTLVAKPKPTGSTTAGAHTIHATDQAYDCGWCHYDSVGTGITHMAGSVTLGFSLFAGAHVGGEYKGQSAVTYDSTEPGTTVSSSGEKACSRVYCHGQLSDGTIWGGGDDVTPTWDGTVTCSSCHDDAGASTALSGRHGKHTDAATYDFDCDRCHYDTATGKATIKDKALHANNVKDVVFPKGGTFSSGDGSCSSFYCHSDARGGPPNTAVKWTDSGPATCYFCHNGKTGEPLEMESNGHKTLVGSSWVRQFPCTYCHDDVVDAGGLIIDYGKHVNGTVDVAIASKWDIVGNPPPSYDPATKVCSDVYCHSDGTTVNPEVRDFAWTDGATSCDSCHGHQPGTCTDCHSDGPTGWPAGEEWRSALPMYPNTGPGTVRANSHVRHAQTDFSCDNCHAATVIAGDCKSCHVNGIPPGSMHDTAHIDPVYHVNKVKDVVFKDGGTYDPLNKTCANTACHTGSTPQWGDTVNSAVLCFQCHGTVGPDVDDFDAFNGSRALINMAEWEDTGHGRPAASGAYESGHPAASFSGNPCRYCHDQAVLHNEADNPFRLKLHDHFDKRFEVECKYCHMEGKDSECLDCHDAATSLAPQLPTIPGPPDHTPYVGGGTSCLSAGCHDTDAKRHDTAAGTWTAAQNIATKSQYLMMGVCLVCHDEDSHNRCQQCHTGPKYTTGYDPGDGLVTAASAKNTSTHFGYKHYVQYKGTGAWRGGKFCWDCHDPHGDDNIFMVQSQIATETDGTFGVPLSKAKVTFDRKQIGTDYAKSSAPYDGICNVCHTDTGQHYRFDYGDGHNAGRLCVDCHQHSASDSHASGMTCDSCHADKPTPRMDAFGLPRDCTKCHDGVIGDRMDILGQLRANSHHIQGVTVTNKHCYACHWEATEMGLIDLSYHAGYNYKTHQSAKDSIVDLVKWGPGVRPTTYQLGTTAILFTASDVGTAQERAAVTNVTDHCLGCHSDQNNDTVTFGMVDPQFDDCKTPRQYAWDGTSIAARYSQMGTATWGKYPGVSAAAKKNVVKAYSAHGNAPANAGGWSVTTGEDESLPDTRAGTEPIQCFDCHGSHGSKTGGVTSSYKTFNGTYNGGNLKETQAGKGGYQMSYKPVANTSGVNPYSTGAALCFDCHETATAGAKPWGYQSSFGASEPIRGYRDGSRFGTGTRGVTDRFAYRASREVIGGHLKPSVPVVGTPTESISGLCTPCHDPHGVTPTLGSNQPYALPLLKGTWLTSPYKEDRPIAKVHNSRFSHPSPPTPNIYIDQNTFGGSGTITETEAQFAGLCLRCHPKADLTDGTIKNQPWRSIDRIHEAVKGWGANTKHSYPCSKCHQPHNSGLPRLLRTNGLDYNHRGRVASGGVVGLGSKGSFPRGNGYRMQNCHPTPEGWPNNYWNAVSAW